MSCRYCTKDAVNVHGTCAVHADVDHGNRVIDHYIRNIRATERHRDRETQPLSDAIVFLLEREKNK